MNYHGSSHRRKNDFIRLDTRRCDACWDCVEVCPKEALGKIDFIWHRHVIILNAGACNGCKKCVRACESKAIEYIYLPNSQAARSMDQRSASDNGLSAYNRPR